MRFKSRYDKDYAKRSVLKLLSELIGNIKILRNLPDEEYEESELSVSIYGGICFGEKNQIS